MRPQEIKEQLYAALKKQVEQRITTARHAMQSAQESRDNETKSSVGDKHETSRAMMQIEQERNKIQLIKAMGLKKELDQININKTKTIVELGRECLGKIEINAEKYFAISKKSPVGKSLLGKSNGDNFKWQGHTFIIEAIT